MDSREREICPACGWVYYLQLKVGAGVLIEKDDQILLLQRAHEPWKEAWNIPAGYVEADEHPKDAAKREVFEETGLVVEIGELLKAYYYSDDPRGNGVALIYKAEVLGVSCESTMNQARLDISTGMRFLKNLQAVVTIK